MCYTTNMMKKFDEWNEVKKEIHTRKERLYFREGEIWWVNLGINIGYEIDGKSDMFSRPVLIVKKYNKYSFLAVPLTTKKKQGKYYISLGDVDGKQAQAIVSQLRNIDSLRLINKVAFIKSDLMLLIKKTIKDTHNL